MTAVCIETLLYCDFVYSLQLIDASVKLETPFTVFPESIGEVDVCIELDGIEELECEFNVALTTVGSVKAGESMQLLDYEFSLL